MSLALSQITVPNPAFVKQMFSAQAVERGGVVRRSVSSVEREIGRDTLLQEVRKRGFHLIECGDQFLIICRRGNITLHM